MTTYFVTKEQLEKLEYALTLAQYFTEGQEQGTDLNKSDQLTVDLAYAAIKQIKGYNA